MTSVHREENNEASETASTGQPSAGQPCTLQPTSVTLRVTDDAQSAAVESLPQGLSLMPRPPPIPGVPPGLEYLLKIDQILIHQRVEVFEVFCGCQTRNKYFVNVGQQALFVNEESGCCMRQCCCSSRGFIFNITDNFGQEVIRVRRELKCCAGCCWCADSDPCGYELQVEAPVGNVCGYVRQIRSGWTPMYMIRDADKEDVFFLQGPCCMWNCICCACCKGDLEFKMFTRDRSEQVGVVSKQFSGVAKECFTSASDFKTSFPVDLDVRMKAVVLSAAFLIDMMFFEK